MSLLAIAWTIVAFLVGALVVVLCVVMANLFRVLTSTKDLIDGVTSQTVPLLGEVNTTVAMVNQELVRVTASWPPPRGSAPRWAAWSTTVSATISSPCQAERVRLRAAQAAGRPPPTTSRGRGAVPEGR